MSKNFTKETYHILIVATIILFAFMLQPMKPAYAAMSQADLERLFRETSEDDIVNELCLSIVKEITQSNVDTATGLLVDVVSGGKIDLGKISALADVSDLISAYKEYKAIDIYSGNFIEERANVAARSMELYGSSVSTMFPGIGDYIGIYLNIGGTLMDGAVNIYTAANAKHMKYITGLWEAGQEELARDLAVAYRLEYELDIVTVETNGAKPDEMIVKLYDALGGADKFHETQTLQAGIKAQIAAARSETTAFINAMTYILAASDDETFFYMQDMIIKYGCEYAASEIMKLAADRDEAKRQASPLTINIDGTGIETLPLEEGVYFDHQGSGFKIKTGWVAPASGLLVHDINGNGKVDSGRELFGDSTLLKNGELAINGFEALKDLCEAEDNIFDARSAAYHELYLWFDLNSNGLTEPGELISLADSDVIAIDLNYSESAYVDVNGNSYLQISTATLADETIVDVIDIWFACAFEDSEAAEQVEVEEKIEILPQIRGFGTTPSLHQAMMQDSSGELEKLVRQFINENDDTSRKELVPQIIYKWTGTSSNIAALDALYGQKYAGGTGVNAIAILNAAFNRIAACFYEILMSQSHYMYLYDRILINKEGELDLSRIAFEINWVTFNNQEAGEKLMLSIIHNMHLMMVISNAETESFKESLARYSSRNAVLAEAVNKPIIRSELGNRNMAGLSSGSLFWVDAAGNTIAGGQGDDIYVFERSTGTNFISDSGGDNIIMLPFEKEEINISISAEGAIISSDNFRTIIADYGTEAAYKVIFIDGRVIDDIFITEVSTIEGLDAVRDNLYGHYRLTSDIDMSSVDWTPIGTAAMPFMGTFDGDGHVIKNLSINTGSGDFIGLFGHLGTGGKVRSVGLMDVSISSTGNYVGSIAGYVFGGLIENCFVTGKTEGNNYVGGIAGILNIHASARVSNCYAVVDIKGGALTSVTSIGGIVGVMNSGTLENSYAAGTVTHAGAGNGTGGVVGHISGTPTVRNCVALNRAVTGTGSETGRVIGRVAGKRTNNYAYDGMVVTQGGVSRTLTKGLTSIDGADVSEANFSSEGWWKDVSNWSTGGGAYGFDFDDVWEMGEKYPYLRIFGHDISDSYVEVSTAEELAAVRDNLYGYYLLTSDIDLSGVEWTPIGTASAPFMGTFDGGGHVIKNLSIKTGSDIGLFGYLGTGSKVRNVGLMDVSIISTGNNIGGIAGIVFGGLVENCFVTGRVEANGYVGGIVGYLNYHASGRISNCYAVVDVKGGTALTSAIGIGGIVGLMANGMLENSYAAGTVTHAGSGSGTGGVAGYAGGAPTVRNCVALNRAVTGTGTETGRAIGRVVGTRVNNYAHDGMVTTQGGASRTLVKGLTSVDGADVSEVSFRSEGWWRNASNWSAANDAYRWDFDSAWEMGEKYPYLRIFGHDISDPYVEVSTAEELDAVRDNLYGYYLLTSDIDLSGVEWTPIGTASAPFMGTFDGGGHVIKNLSIKTGSDIGLFGYLGTGSKVRNVGLMDVSIISTGNNIGGIAGIVFGGLVENCFVTGRVEANGYVGGIVGYLNNHASGRISNCYAVVDVKGGTALTSAIGVGGIVGLMANGILENSYAAGTVIHAGSGNGTGGVAGYAGGAPTVRNCVALNRAVTGTGTETGRAIGRVVGTRVNNYAYDGMVATQGGESRTLAKGMTTVDGADVSEANFRNVGWWKTASNWSASGSAYKWDFDGTWEMGEKYPYLRIFGHDISDSYVEVSTAEELDALRDNLYGHYRLTSDIDLSGMEWTPIGTAAAPFMGTFDGDGHVIKELSIKTGNDIGLFGYLGTGSKVMNIGLTDVSIINAGDNVGGIAGRVFGGLVENCFVTGRVEGNNNVGGIVGIIASHASGRVRNCYAVVDVKGGISLTSAIGIGGIVGRIGNGTLENSYAAGTVIHAGIGNGTGGVVGYIGGTSTVRNCVALNRAVTGTGTETGRVLGRIVGTVANNHAYDGMVTTAGGKLKTLAKGLATVDGADVSETNFRSESWWKNTAKWDFASIWEISEAGYPILRGLPKPWGSITIMNEFEIPVNMISDSKLMGVHLIGEMISIEPMLNDDWVFIEWQDENGNTLCTDEIYSFVIRGNMTLNLIIEPADSFDVSDEPAEDDEDDLMEQDNSDNDSDADNDLDNTDSDAENDMKKEDEWDIEDISDDMAA